MGFLRLDSKICDVLWFIHSFIHSFILFYRASSSPPLLRGAPDTARILCRNSTPKRQRQLWVKDLLMPKVPTWRLEREWRMASTQPMRHPLPNLGVPRCVTEVRRAVTATQRVHGWRIVERPLEASCETSGSFPSNMQSRTNSGLCTRVQEAGGWHRKPHWTLQIGSVHRVRYARGEGMGLRRCDSLWQEEGWVKIMWRHAFPIFLSYILNFKLKVMLNFLL